MPVLALKWLENPKVHSYGPGLDIGNINGVFLIWLLFTPAPFYLVGKSYTHNYFLAIGFH